jgi:hypothetical protein
MSLFTTPNFASIGSINVPAYFSVPPLVNFIAEWASFVPLVCHLANYHHPHQLAGQVALLGRVSVALFPKLGVLAGISRLLERGPEFLDIASTLGPSSRRVWDVKWGGTFPSANGAASSYFAESLLKHNDTVIKIPETVPPMPLDQVSATRAGSKSINGSIIAVSEDLRQSFQTPATISTQAPPGYPNFRRYQTLHVLHFSKSPHAVSWRSKLDRFLSSPLLTAINFTLKLGLIIVLCLFGIYGTATLLLSSSITQLISRMVKVHRPPAFLGNNETHDACMLVATHQNASIWYLFVGDRGIVDSLLNKTMVSIPRQKFAAAWFRTAHIIQLVAMTFVASQRGWDGVSLLILLIISTFMELRFRRELLTRIFCEENGVLVRQKSFEFSGRTPMLGAIQKLSRSRSWFWMDEILASCPRREIWARSLSREEPDGGSFEEDIRYLSKADKKWAWMNKILAIRGADLMRRIVQGPEGV